MIRKNQTIIILHRWAGAQDSLPNRWDGTLLNYQNSICHQTNNVIYIIDNVGRTGIPADTPVEKLHLVVNINDIDELSRLLTKLISEYGEIDKLIALPESLIDISAQLREKFNIHGMGFAESQRYRNKVLMKSILTEQGISTPHFSQCVTADITLAFAQEHRYPFILKPIDGEASNGVYKVHSEEQLKELLPNLELNDYEIEEFITGDIYHVDGLVNHGGEIVLCLPSKYINTCMDFSTTTPLGSITLNQSKLRDSIELFTHTCIEALQLKSSPFHLELFVTYKNELIFLEMGARVGGSDVPYVLYDVTGVNIFDCWLKMLMGETLWLQKSAQNGTGGWLLFSKPEKLPVKVNRVTTLKGKIESINRELIPQVGIYRNDANSYASLQSGRFVFYSADENRVLADIKQAINTFDINYENI